MILLADALEMLAALLVVLGLVLVASMAIPVARGVWFRLFPPPARRDVSRLDVSRREGDDEGLDAVHETVADEGAPLKPHHRRRVLRDPRLLPKPKPPENVWPRPK